MCGIFNQMKKIKFLFLPLLAISSLSGCNQIDKEHSILPFLNYDSKAIGTNSNEDYLKYTYEITPFRLHELLDHQATFPLYLYGEHCIHCNNFKPILGQYIKNTHRQFYKCTFKTEEEYNFVVNDYPEVFKNYTGTPSMLFIKDGELTYQVANTKFQSYEAFATIVKKHFYEGNLYTIDSLDGLKYYLNDYKDTFIYCYDDASNVSIEIFKTIYDKMLNNKSQNLLILNKNEILEENYKDICDYFELHIDDIFAINVTNGELTKTADYTADGGELLKDYLATYFH